jgi:hypothetical protein
MLGLERLVVAWPPLQRLIPLLPELDELQSNDPVVTWMVILP